MFMYTVLTSSNFFGYAKSLSNAINRHFRYRIDCDTLNVWSYTKVDAFKLEIFSHAAVNTHN